MQRYKEFQPTICDPKGLNADDYSIGDFMVVPVGQNRDSNCLQISNFEKALERLGGESDAVQVHRFNHWGPGWFEIILVDPKSDKVKIAEQIEADLESYPVLDDEHFSNMEQVRAAEIWENMLLDERIACLQRFHIPIFAARREYIPNNSELIATLAE